MLRIGAESEAFCRQAMIVFERNSHIVPPGLDLAGALPDPGALALLRPRFSRMRQLAGGADGSEAALGGDLMSLALEGRALAKVRGKRAAVETQEDAISVRYGRKARNGAGVAA